MKVCAYNNILFKGKVNKKFYFYLLKKNKKLYKYLFINIYYKIMSILFYSKKDSYIKNKYKYLKEVENIEEEIKQFYSEKNNYKNNIIVDNFDTIIEKEPKILIKNDSMDVIGFELDKDFVPNLEKFKKEIKNQKNIKVYLHQIKDCSNLIKSENYIIKIFNLYFTKKRKFFSFLFKEYNVNNFILIISILSLIVTIMSFFLTRANFDNFMMFKSYFEIRLFLLNYIPIFLFMLFIYNVFRKINVSFFVTSSIILILGISNQTKLFYRNDVVKFEDLKIINEAFLMAEKYDIIIKKYTIFFILFILFLTLFLRRVLSNKVKSTYNYFLSIFIIILVSMTSYFLLFTNQNIWDKVGSYKGLNRWISVTQSQVKGLIYPFIYSSSEGIMKKPAGYNVNESKKILNSYKYENIEYLKKVNFIAVMLESFNDFTKFDSIEFTEDIYKPFHNIQNRSISGNLVVEIFGGNTIVTERSFLTGYRNLPSFRRTSNSFVRYFKEQGYVAELMHPIYGDFYNRVNISRNMGFDYYHNYENQFSEISKDFNFINDDRFFVHLIQNYEKQMMDNNNYFNFSITYQNHGPYIYHDDKTKTYFIKPTNMDISTYKEINFYFEGIKNTIQSLEKLINYFEKVKEPVVVIIFGDHNPSFGKNNIPYEQLGINLDISTIEGFRNYYEVPYIIYGNKSLKKLTGENFEGKGDTIGAMFLMPDVFNLLGYKGDEFMQYLLDLRSEISFFNDKYVIEKNEYLKKELSSKKNKINEYNKINYYMSTNFVKK